MGPAMSPVNPLLFIVIWIITWMMVYSLPAAVCHVLIRKFWMACATVALGAFVCGYGVAVYCQSMYPNVPFPMNYSLFALVSSLSGLATALVAGIPFVLYRRGMRLGYWPRRGEEKGK